jgi:hypothetical protein
MARLWRMRKLHQSIDAELHGDREVVLQFKLNGEMSYERRLATRDEALAEAARKRAELERDGWMFHW